MTARKVVTRSGRKIRGYFPSLKMKRMVAWESLLERDMILLMEFSQGIVQFREQPELVLYDDGDVQRRYFPDFEITTSAHVLEHIEVKSEAQLRRPVIEQKLSLVANNYAQRGLKYRVLSDRDIRREPLLGNLKLLAHARRLSPEVEFVRDEVRKLLKSGEINFQYLEKQLGRDLLIKLIACGDVRCDLHLSLTGGNRLLHPEEADNDQILF